MKFLPSFKPWLAATALLLSFGVLAQEAAIRKTLAERLPNLPKIDEITRTPIPGVYEVRYGGTEIFYSDATGEHILSGSLIVRTPRADANGPAIEASKWYSVRFVFDGAGLQLSVNGQEIPQPKGSEIGKDCTRDLIIGQYETQDPRYAFRGHIRNLRIYAEAVGDR